MPVHPQPQPADPLHHRRNGPPDGRDLRGEHVRLLGAHPLRGAPAQSQHKGRDPRLGHHLFQNLPHRHLAVQDGRVSADDLDIHISHSHKVPHAAAPGILHGPGPLSCQHPAPLLRLAVSAVPAGDGEAQAAASLPVNPDGVVDLHQDIRQKREPPQKGHAIGAVRLRIQRR
ncbi:FMN reductase [NAD(P)H], partial [Dysosmobacter welbionis]